MNLSDRLDQVASLLEQGLNDLGTKSASTQTPVINASNSDLGNSIKFGIYMNTKKASYLELFKDLNKGGFLR